MKIDILFDFEKSAGGGKQFLKALQKDFLSLGASAESPKEADVFLFNSYHNLKEVVGLKKKYPNKTFIHRLGPVFHFHRGKRWKLVDKTVLDLSQRIADGFIFQSTWSLNEAKKLGFKADEASYQVILNWPDKSIFYPLKEKVFKGGFQKIKLIATSWSSNRNKGFEVYKFLDANLNFNKYEMLFLGNLPLGLTFKNIKRLPAVSSSEVAEHLRASDIFIFAGKDEACSNALIEALACGLPCLAFKSSSNPEVLGAGGELFESPPDLLNKLEKIVKNYHIYQNHLPVYLIQNTAKAYLQFIQRLSTIRQRGQIKSKRISFKAKLKLLKMQAFLFKGRVINKIKTI
ncbi:MAG: glycosyltransferase [bacterium]|nr:glycosyltransferase [bacterium]